MGKKKAIKRNSPNDEKSKENKKKRPTVATTLFSKLASNKPPVVVIKEEKEEGEIDDSDTDEMDVFSEENWTNPMSTEPGVLMPVKTETGVLMPVKTEPGVSMPVKIEPGVSMPPSQCSETQQNCMVKQAPEKWMPVSSSSENVPGQKRESFSIETLKYFNVNYTLTLEDIDECFKILEKMFDPVEK